MGKWAREFSGESIRAQGLGWTAAGQFHLSADFPYPRATDCRWKVTPWFRGALRSRFLSTEPVD